MKLMLGLQLLLKKIKVIYLRDGKGGLLQVQYGISIKKIRCVARNTSFNSLGYQEM